VASEEFFEGRLVTTPRAVKKVLGVIRMSVHIFPNTALQPSGTTPPQTFRRENVFVGLSLLPSSPMFRNQPLDLVENISWNHFAHKVFRNSGKQRLITHWNPPETNPTIKYCGKYSY